MQARQQRHLDLVVLDDGLDHECRVGDLVCLGDHAHVLGVHLRMRLAQRLFHLLERALGRVL